MKKTLVILSFILALFAGTVQAQSTVFKVNVLSPLVKTGSVFFEHAIAEDKSLQLGVFYTGFSAEGTKFSGYGITPEFRKYFSENKQAPAGFYAAPFLRFQSFNLKMDDSGEWADETPSDAKGTFKTFGGGLIVGNQWVLDDRFVIDAFFGPSYNAGKVKVESGNEESFDLGSFSGFGIRTGIAFGIKF